MKRDGGVLIATKANFYVNHCILRVKSSAIDIYQVIVKLTLNNKTELFVIASYIPPRSSSEVYKMHFDNCRSFIENLSSNQHILFPRDFNLGPIAWHNIRSSNLPFAADSDKNFKNQFIIVLL